MSLYRIINGNELVEKCLLTPMETLQARLDYAHHIKKAGIKNGSQDDVKAIGLALITKAIPIIAEEAKREERERIIEFINWLDNGTRSSASWRSEVRKFGQALKGEDNKLIIAEVYRKAGEVGSKAFEVYDKEKVNE